MRSYRVYYLDGRGHITHRHELDADSDAGAIAHARTHHSEFDCEIWELGRKVALVPVGGPPKLFDIAP